MPSGKPGVRTIVTGSTSPHVANTVDSVSVPDTADWSSHGWYGR